MLHSRKVTLDLYTSDFSALGGADLYDAIIEFTRCNLPPDDRAQEGYLVDFKEKWSERSLRVVAAFANTFGGIIVVGVSEERGKAKEILGEESKGELKTRLAAAIAAAITPTPSFDLAECEIPGSTNRRLCVIRVRPANRIHFLTTKDHSPVYVRNEDQAIPARAAELRSLIAREWEGKHSSSPLAVDHIRIFRSLPITKAQRTDAEQTVSEQRIAADSLLRVWVTPEQKCQVSIDYSTELNFRDLVFKTFPKDAFAADSTWTSDEATAREKNFFRIDYARVQRDMESKWLFTNAGEFGYATVLSVDAPPGKPLWSLADVTAELIASVRVAHALLASAGYFAEAQIDIWASLGEAELYVERGALPFLRHCGCSRALGPGPLWRQIVPRAPHGKVNRTASASASSNFFTRTEAISGLIADLLNQILRDLGYGADLKQLREHAKAVGG